MVRMRLLGSHHADNVAAVLTAVAALERFRGLRVQPAAVWPALAAVHVAGKMDFRFVHDGTTCALLLWPPLFARGIEHGLAAADCHETPMPVMSSFCLAPMHSLMIALVHNMHCT
jgi:hypothetical protein